jgi:hypothetical protein
MEGRMIKKAFVFFFVCFTHLAALDTGDPVKKPGNRDFTFVRLIYSDRSWSGSSWAVDYPKADEQFVYGVRKFSDLDFAAPDHKALTISDPELFNYPFAYAVEVGYLQLSDEEAAILREYLLRGGFLMVDDFHGEWEWHNFYQQMKKVLPEYEPVDLPVSHPIFNCYYEIPEHIQVPGIQYLYTGRMSEKGGVEARYMGISDDNGRLMVMINFNSDLGDAWEWAEMESYPREWATRAYQLGINYIIYSMSH